jgi:hypothetical protein
MKTLDEIGKDGVIPMTLIYGSEDITKVSPGTLVDDIVGSTISDVTLGPDMI